MQLLSRFSSLFGSFDLSTHFFLLLLLSPLPSRVFLSCSRRRSFVSRLLTKMDKYELDESLVTRPNDYGFYYKYHIVERRQWFFVFRNCSSLKIRLSESESLRDSNEKKERKEKKGKTIIFYAFILV